MYKLIKLLILNSLIFLVYNCLNSTQINNKSVSPIISSTSDSKNKENNKVVKKSEKPIALNTQAIIQPPTNTVAIKTNELSVNKVEPITDISTLIQTPVQTLSLATQNNKSATKTLAANASPEISTPTTSICENNQASCNKTCGYCPSNSTFNKDNKTCKCDDPNSIISKSTINSEGKTYFQCLSCTANLMPSKDQTACICKDFNDNKKKVVCNKYSTNLLKFNRNNGTYTCNNPEQVVGFDYKNNIFKCYSCPTDAKFDKENQLCICSKPDAKNLKNNIDYSPIVLNENLICNPNIK